MVAFFELPEGYNFQNVAKVHNHSYVSESGELIPIRGMKDFERNYKPSKVYRERPYFECFINLTRNYEIKPRN